MFYVLTSSYFMVISCQEQHSKHSTGGITKPDDVMVATSIFQIQSIELIDICLNVGGEYNTDTIATLIGKNKTKHQAYCEIHFQSLKRKVIYCFFAVSFESE